MVYLAIASTCSNLFLSASSAIICFFWRAVNSVPRSFIYFIWYSLVYAAYRSRLALLISIVADSSSFCLRYASWIFLSISSLALLFQWLNLFWMKSVFFSWRAQRAYAGCLLLAKSSFRKSSYYGVFVFNVLKYWVVDIGDVGCSPSPALSKVFLVFKGENYVFSWSLCCLAISLVLWYLSAFSLAA